MNKLHQTFTKTASAMIFVAAVIAAAPSLAANTTLNGVEISSGERGYDIVLNTDTATNIEKKSVTSDQLVLDLKNTKVAKDANTVYKNADGIENVIMKPKANNLQIEINGKEAGNSNVKLNNEIAETPKAEKDYSNTVFINRPLESYTPTNDMEDMEENVGFLGLLGRIAHSDSLKNLLMSPNLGWLVCFLLLTGFFLINNPNRKQRKSQVNVKISNQNENELLKSALQRKEGLIAESTGTAPRRTMQPRNPQPQVNSQRTNYGLRAYNNQQTGVNTQSFRPQPARQQRKTNTPQPTAQYRQMRATTATAQELKQDIKKNEVRIDNVKFLESMAKIYERSGRVDLANGLANNIKKAKTIR